MQIVHDTTRPGPAVTWFSDLVVTPGGIGKAGSMEESSDLINNAMLWGAGSEVDYGALVDFKHRRRMRF